MEVQELLQLLQLGGSARLPRPARRGRAGSGDHALPFTFQERFARLLQARLVGWDVRTAGLVQMHGPRAAETLNAQQIPECGVLKSFHPTVCREESPVPSRSHQYETV